MTVKIHISYATQIFGQAGWVKRLRYSRLHLVGEPDGSIYLIINAGADLELVPILHEF